MLSGLIGHELRLPRIEWAGYWNKTTNRWYVEGLALPCISPFLAISRFQQDFNVKGCQLFLFGLIDACI